MLVLINSKAQQFSGKNIAELIQSLNLPSTHGVALAVNDKVVPKTDWEIVELKENDKLTIIKATQGG